MTASLRRAWHATTHFLADLLALETPEIPLTAALVVLAAFLLKGHTVVAVVALPLLVLGGLTVSVWRAKGPPSDVPARSSGSRSPSD